MALQFSSSTVLGARAVKIHGETFIMAQTHKDHSSVGSLTLAFSGLTLLVWRQEGHQAFKKMVEVGNG